MSSHLGWSILCSTVLTCSSADSQGSLSAKERVLRNGCGNWCVLVCTHNSTVAISRAQVTNNCQHLFFGPICAHISGSRPKRFDGTCSLNYDLKTHILLTLKVLMRCTKLCLTPARLPKLVLGSRVQGFSWFRSNREYTIARPTCTINESSHTHLRFHGSCTLPVQS